MTEFEETEPLYTSLDSSLKEVRLLTVYPSEDSGAIIRSRLHKVQLANDPKPEYETISYVWGDPTPKEWILIDSCRIQIPTSSDAVLRAIRHHSQPRTIWLDAVCIDQTNVREREQQVTLMEDVYRNTQNGIIYLGEGDQDLYLAKSQIDALMEEIMEDTDNLTNLTGTRLGVGADYSSLAQTGLRGHYDFRLVQKFYLLPWFSRVWVFQEAALAPRSTILLGSMSTTLLTVVRVAVWLMYKHLFVPANLIFTQGIHTSINLLPYIDDGRDAPTETSIMRLREIGRDLKSTDGRDQVFVRLIWSLANALTLLIKSHRACSVLQRDEVAMYNHI